MASPPAAGPSSGTTAPGRILTLGPVHRLTVQVGYRISPESAAYDQYLLDVAVAPPDAAGGSVDPGPGLDEAGVLAALEPVLFAGARTPRHYSLHHHRSHTSWGTSPGALDLGLLVTSGRRTASAPDAAAAAVTESFRDLMTTVGGPEPRPATRDDAVRRARRGVASAYGLEPGSLTLSAEEHHPSSDSWTVGFRGAQGDEYDVLVGLVDGYAGSLRIRHEKPIEVSTSVGTE